MIRCIARLMLCLALLVCLGQLNGCGSATADVAGTYEMDKELIKEAMRKDMEESGEADAAMMAPMMNAMIDSMTLKLVLNEDGTATMTMSAMGDTKNGAGTWTIDGDSISITMAEEGGEPDTATGTLKDGVITMKLPGEDDMPFDMVFNKVEANK